MSRSLSRAAMHLAPYLPQKYTDGAHDQVYFHSGRFTLTCHSGDDHFFVAQVHKEWLTGTGG